MALFLFIGKCNDLLRVLSDDEMLKLRRQYDAVNCICITDGDALESEDLGPGVSMATAEDLLDGTLLMKRLMDQEKIVEAECIVPKENLKEFDTVKELIFPPICKITIDTYAEETSVNCWKPTIDADVGEIFKNKLRKIDKSESVHTVQSKIIPSDLFIHGYSKRYGGISKFPGMKSLNLVYSLRKPDSIFVVKENARRLCQYLGVNHEKYHLAKANHGNKVWVYENTPPESYDGIVTNTQGVTVASPAADCNMLLLADPVTKSCGAIHAGWKGILAGIVESAVDAMVSSYDSNPADIKASLGPSLSVCCCEFGAVDSIPFSKIGSDVVMWIEGKVKPHINLRLATTILLQKCGVKAENIDDGVNGLDPTPVIATCTKCDPNKDFFSYRRDGAKFGNQVAFISLRETALPETA